MLERYHQLTPLKKKKTFFLEKKNRKLNSEEIEKPGRKYIQFCSLVLRGSLENVQFYFTFHPLFLEFLQDM